MFNLNLKEYKDIMTWGPVLFLTGLFYYLYTPLTGDLFVNLGVAHLADIQYGGGIQGAIKSWDLRLIAHRCYIYFHYVVANKIVSFENKHMFIFIVKILNLYLVLISATCFCKLFKVNKLNGYLLYAGIILLVPFRAVLQPEYVCALLSVIGVYFLTLNSYLPFFVGCLITAILPFFKGITLFFSIQSFIILYFIFEVKNFKSKLFASLLLFAVFLFSLYLYYPTELYDLKDATLFQSSPIVFTYPLIKSFFHDTTILLLFYPFVFVMFAFSVISIIESFSDKKQLALFFSFLLGFLAILVQGHFFVYHYAMLLLPAFFGMPLFFESKSKSKLPFFLIFLTLFINFLMLTTPLQNLLSINYSNIPVANKRPLVLAQEWSYTVMKDQLDELDRISSAISKLNIRNSTPVLYLDDGRGVWSAGLPSELRYPFPLPVQRSSPHLKQTEVYKTCLDKILNFDGDLVVHQDDWFNLAGQEFEKFRRKLASYRKIEIEGSHTVLYIKKVN